MKILAAALMAFALSANAYTPAPRLEKTFWDCDYLFSVGKLSAAGQSTCMNIYHALVQAAFEGDYNEFEGWWLDNVDNQRLRRKAGI